MYWDVGVGEGVSKKSETFVPCLFYYFCCRVSNVPKRVLYIDSSFIGYTRGGSYEMLIKVYWDA